MKELAGNLVVGMNNSYCDVHSSVETSLRCAKCSKLICPKCMVSSPVGYRCGSCSTGVNQAFFSVSATEVFKAMSISVIGAIGCGVSLVFLMDLLPQSVVLANVTGHIILILLAIFSYSLGGLISLTVNRKRGKILKFIGGFGVLIMFVVTVLGSGMVVGIGLLLSLVLGIWLAVFRL